MRPIYSEDCVSDDFRRAAFGVPGLPCAASAASRHAASWPSIDWTMPAANARAARPCHASPISTATAGSRASRRRPLARLLARMRGDFHWGQTYTAADFGQSFIDNYGWLEVFGTRGHFANDKIAGGFLDPRPGHRLSRPSPCRGRNLHSADRRDGLAHGRRRVCRRDGGRGHPPCLQRQPRHAHRRRTAAGALPVARRAACRALDRDRLGRAGRG